MKSTRHLLCAICTICGLSLGSVAEAQLTPVSIQAGISNTWLMTNGFYLLATNARPLQVQQGKGFAISAILGATTDALTTGQVCLRFTISADGTNYANETNKMFCHWIQPAGIGPSITYSNYPPSLVDHARYIKLYDCTNANTGVTCVVARLTNLTFVIKN